MVPPPLFFFFSKDIFSLEIDMSSSADNCLTPNK